MKNFCIFFIKFLFFHAETSPSPDFSDWVDDWHRRRYRIGDWTYLWGGEMFQRWSWIRIKNARLDLFVEWACVSTLGLSMEILKKCLVELICGIGNFFNAGLEYGLENTKKKCLVELFVEFAYVSFNAGLG